MKTKHVVAAIALAGSILATAAHAVPNAAQLPEGITPIHYEIAVRPDATKMLFTGQETVTISVAKPTRTITLNATEIAIGGVRLDALPVSNYKLDAEKQTLTITLKAPAKVGVHKLAIGWSGKINQSATGLFAIDYDDARGHQRMLATQFEATDGRRFAPMWDQPDFKATFTLTTQTPKAQTAFSNMPVASTRVNPDGTKLVTFRETPKMSSYLLYLGIGDVDRITTRVGPTEIGVITRRGATRQGRYALESAARILAYYNDYFGTPYPLPKLDMIAGPGSSQFFGAMENWGAIFYFERDLLIDPKLSNESSRQGVFNVVAHEMAHQWFGDLVTMSWWSDIWLNEGYASWMAGKVSNDLNPSWNIAAQGVAFSKQAAMAADSRTGTHPIVQKIETLSQISQAFDSITYGKGSKVIRMLEGFIGDTAFREGVRRYMAKHKYGNTVTDDLWVEMAAAAGRPVKPLMDAFTLKVGVPMIVAGSARCDGTLTHMTLSQERFATDASQKTPSTWPVPVNLAIGHATAQPVITGSGMQSADVAACGTLVVDPGQYGYYRTLLAPDLYTATIAAYDKLSLIDQIGMLSDRAYLADAGYAPLDSVFALIDRVPADADPLVWNVIAGRMASYDDMLDGDPAQAPFRARAISLLEPQFKRVGYAARPGEAPALAQLREKMITVLGTLGDPEVVGQARRLVGKGLDNIPAAIREDVTGVYARNVDPTEWQKIREDAKGEKNPMSQLVLYSQLGFAADPALAQKTLDLALTEEASVPNRAVLISGVAQRHPAMAFDWAVAHADQVEPLIEESSRGEFIPQLAYASKDPAVADRVEAFAKKTKPTNEQRAAMSVVANIRYSAEVKARNRSGLAVWANLP